MSLPVQQAMMPLQIALGALLTKSVGSIYRIRDVREAPPLIQANVKHREAVIMTAATAFSLAVQAVLSTGPVKSLIEKSPIAKFAIFFQSALMAGALCLGELAGRYMTPPLDWHEVEVQEIHEKPDNKSEITPSETIPINRKETKIMNVGSSQASFMKIVPSIYTMPDYSAHNKMTNILSASDHSAKSSSIAFGQRQESKLQMSGSVGIPQDKVQTIFNKLDLMA